MSDDIQYSRKECEGRETTELDKEIRVEEKMIVKY